MSAMPPQEEYNVDRARIQRLIQRIAPNVKNLRIDHDPKTDDYELIGLKSPTY